jgi:hypothetical protein
MKQRPRGRRWFAAAPAGRLAGALAVLAACAVLASCAVYAGQASSGPAAGVPAPAHPDWVSTARFGAWNNSGFTVFNNEWNTAQAGPQRIWADSFHFWGVESRQSLPISVKTYPSVQRNYPNVPISSFARLTSTFAESMPGTQRFGAEAAYDIWLDGFAIEVMIWVDNHGRTPSGGLIAQVRLNHQEFGVYRNGAAMFSFTLTGQQETAGKVDILAFLRWLVGHHYLQASDGLRQLDFGWEIATTDGTTLDFRMRQYALSAVLTRAKSP